MTDSFAPFSRSKNSAGPRRAPSGRPALSTLITRAPVAASRLPHKGPAQSEVKSSTSGGSPGCRVPPRLATTGSRRGPAGPRGTAPPARPNSATRSSASPDVTPVSHRATDCHAAPSPSGTAASPTRAGMSSTSDSLARERPNHPSRVGSMRNAPPAGPRRVPRVAGDRRAHREQVDTRQDGPGEELHDRFERCLHQCSGSPRRGRGRPVRVAGQLGRARGAPELGLAARVDVREPVHPPAPSAGRPRAEGPRW